MSRLTAEELPQVDKAANVRDRAIRFFMADSGLRREETVLLNWGDIDIKTGSDRGAWQERKEYGKHPVRFLILTAYLLSRIIGTDNLYKSELE